MELVYQILFQALLFFMRAVAVEAVGLLLQELGAMEVEAQDLRLPQPRVYLAALIRAEVAVAVLDQEVELAEREDRA